MKTLGIATRVKDKTATVSFVVLDVPDGLEFGLERVEVSSTFDIKVDEAPTAEQLGLLAERVDGRIQSIAPDRVCVRRADVTQQASKKEGPKFRLLLEGAITAAAYSSVRATTIRTGKACASAHGAESKDAFDAVARALVQQAKYAEAAAAALAAFSD